MESNNMKFPDDPSVTLTIRLIMQGKVSRICIRLLIFYCCCAFTFRQNENEIYPSIISNTSSRKSFIFMIFHEKIYFSFSAFYSAIHVNPAINKSWSDESSSVTTGGLKGSLGKGSFTLGNFLKGQLAGKCCWIF